MTEVKLSWITAMYDTWKLYSLNKLINVFYEFWMSDMFNHDLCMVKRIKFYSISFYIQTLHITNNSIKHWINVLDSIGKTF